MKVQYFKSFISAISSHFLLVILLMLTSISAFGSEGQIVHTLIEGQPVPKKFSNLIQQIKNDLSIIFFPANVEISQDAFDGRSLDQDFDSVLWPRRVVGFKVGDRQTFSKSDYIPVFLGYAPLKGRLEIISSSTSDLGGYEFRLVDHFMPDSVGTKMSLSKKQNNICMACHQSGAGIFPKAPWNEAEGTNHNFIFHSQEKIYDQVAASPDTGTVAFKIENRYEKQQTENPELSDFADDGRTVFTHPLTLDVWVRNSNYGAQVKRIIGGLCNSDISCLKQVLHFMVFKKLGVKSDAAGIIEKKLIDYFNEQQRLDKAPFSYPSSVIPDRTLNVGTDGHVPFYLEKDERVNDELKETIYDESQSATGLFLFGGNHINLKGYRSDVFGESSLIFRAADHPGNPLKARPLVSGIKTVTDYMKQIFDNTLPYVFGIAEEQIQYFLKSEDFWKIEENILRNPSLDLLLKTPGFTGSEILQLISRETSSELKVELWAQKVRHMQNKSRSRKDSKAQVTVSSEAVFLDQFRGLSRERKVKKYAEFFCSACHSDASIAQLPLNNPKALSNYRSLLWATPDERISSGEMPPESFRKNLAEVFFNGEEEDLEQYLAEFSEMIKSFRDVDDR